MYSPLFLPQGSLPQLPPVDVMAAPALSWCLSLLLFLLPLPIPRASTVVKGEDPGIWAAVPGTLPWAGPSSGAGGREEEGRGNGTRDQVPTSPSTLCPAPCPPATPTCLSKSQEGCGLLSLSCLSLPVGTLQSLGLCLVLSEMCHSPLLCPWGWLTSSSGRLRVPGAGMAGGSRRAGPGAPCSWPLTACFAGRHSQAHVLLQLESQHLLHLEPGWGPAGHFLPHPCEACSTVRAAAWLATPPQHSGVLPSHWSGSWNPNPQIPRHLHFENLG